MELDISDVMRRKAIASGAELWVDSLPGLVEDMCAAWDLGVDESLGGGTEALVLAVTIANETPAVLKLCIPRDGDAARHEAAVLASANGGGCAALFRSDIDRGALLMERLGRSLNELDLPIRKRHEIMCSAAERLWRPASDLDLPSGADKGRWLIDFIEAVWERTDRPCTERAVAYAFECAERRIAAHDDERALLAHGDIHEWNTLATADDATRFKLIDPDGLLAEPEYDLGIIMREDPVDLVEGDPRRRSRWLARRTGLNEKAIWEWGVVERMSTGLLLTEIGLEPVGRQMLVAAEVVAAT
jgi:streptomycin 6-kinase